MKILKAAAMAVSIAVLASCGAGGNEDHASYNPTDYYEWSYTGADGKPYYRYLSLRDDSSDYGNGENNINAFINSIQAIGTYDASTVRFKVHYKYYKPWKYLTPEDGGVTDDEKDVTLVYSHTGRSKSGITLTLQNLGSLNKFEKEIARRFFPGSESSGWKVTMSHIGYSEISDEMFEVKDRMNGNTTELGVGIHNNVSRWYTLDYERDCAWLGL